MTTTAPKDRETPDIETASDGYAARFQGSAGEYLLQVQRDCIDRVLGDMRGVRVLDAGGAHGQLIEQLLERDCDITVLSSSELCGSERVLSKHAACNIVIGDHLAMPFDARSFDLVISVRLISHIDNWQQMLGEWCRVCRGAIVFDYPRVGGLNALTPLLFPLKRRIEGNTRTYTSFSTNELAEPLNSQGFDVTRQEAQFALPMGLHRAARGARPLQMIERGLRAIGLAHRATFRSTRQP
ncbi:MAG: methyltransferase domain-containing protein [Pseudomonadota bacterium]